MKRVKVLTVLVLLISISTSYAQISKFKDKLKGKKSEQGGQGKTTKLPALVFDRPIPTAVWYSSFLKHATFYESGLFRLEHVSVAFPPNKDETGAAPDYREKRFHVRIMNGENVVSDKYYQPQFTEETYIKFEVAETRGSDVELMEGKYNIQFMMDDKLFSEVPVEVVKVENKDPYAKVKEKYFLHGPWNDYALLSWTNPEDLSNGEQPKLHLKMFYQLEDMLNQGKDDVKIHSELLKDGKYFATTAKEEIDLTNTWQSFQNAFFKIPANAQIDTDKILRKNGLPDGKYQIKNYVEGKPRVFSFEIKGGNIIASGRQVRQSTEPTKFIEGMNEEWFVQAEGSTYLK
jgi:hypothetical protein